jgi:uncharacterized membrane protein (UPF0127 family)
MELHNEVMTKHLDSVKIQSLKNQMWVADQCEVASSFFARFRGLIGRKKLSLGQGLLLRPCNDIHMWFMSIPIDVVFLRKVEDRSVSSAFSGATCYEVTSVRENLKPWKVLPTHDWSAQDTLELPPGTVFRCDIRPGDRLCIN